MSDEADKDLHNLFAVEEEDEPPRHAFLTESSADAETENQAAGLQTERPGAEPEVPDDHIPVLTEVASAEDEAAVAAETAPPSPPEPVAPEPAPPPDPQELYAIVDAAVQAALPAAIEQVAATLHDSLLDEIRQRVMAQLTEGTAPSEDD